MSQWRARVSRPRPVVCTRAADAHDRPSRREAAAAQPRVIDHRRKRGKPRAGPAFQPERFAVDERACAREENKSAPSAGADRIRRNRVFARHRGIDEWRRETRPAGAWSVGRRPTETHRLSLCVSASHRSTLVPLFPTDFPFSVWNRSWVATRSRRTRCWPCWSSA